MKNSKLSKIRKKLIKEGKVKAFGHGISSRFAGKNNGMFGKHHTKETKEKISKYVRTPEVRKNIGDARKKLVNDGWRCPNKGMTYEEYYGKEKAEKLRAKLSKSHKGNWDSKRRKKFGENRSRLLRQGKIKTIFKNGKDNPAYIDGLAYEPYSNEFNKFLKEEIRKRDNNICQLCGREDDKRELSIHHINYNKKDCSLSNLVSLCGSCHSKTNYNRLIWEIYLMNKVIDTYLGFDNLLNK